MSYAFARTLMDRTDVLSLDESTVDQAAAPAIRYQLSHWDALIVAAALQHGSLVTRRPWEWSPCVAF